MKQENKLTRFDTPDTLLVVSLYPKKGETYSAGTTGVASYTKNLVTAMQRPVVVLADTHNGEPKSYREKNTLVVHCFTPGKISMWAELIKQISQFKQAKTVLIQFDFSMYGSMITSALLIPFVGVLKALGYQVSVVSHHVVTDVRKLRGHLGLSNSWFDWVKALFFTLAFKAFYFALSFVTESIIVLEEMLQQMLQKRLPANKVVAIPHAVDTSLKPRSKALARQKLGLGQKEQVVLFFGFVNWFKGADLFASFFESVDIINGRPARFIIAGGESVTLKQKAYYQKYYQGVLDTIDQSHRVEMTGYVPQSKIADYFAAADLVVFPYRTFMCASGVMSLTFSYQKPFIISESLSSLLDDPDFKTACKAVGLKSSDVTFKLTKHDAIKVTEKVLHNGLKPKLRKLCSALRQARSFEKNARHYEQTLFGKQSAKQKSVLPGTSQIAYA